MFAALADLVLPRRCVGCGSPLGPLCPRCRPAAVLPPVPLGPVTAVAAAEYADAVRTAVLAYKERGRRDLAGPLAGLLADAVQVAVAGRDPPGARVLLVPVPSARAAARARGGQHVERLARRCAVRTGLRVAPDALLLARRLRDSAGLRVAERAANLDGAMTARPAPPNAAALIVDDIVTTGATLREAARALAAAGWPVAGAAVIATVPRRVAASIGSAQPFGLA